MSTRKSSCLTQKFRSALELHHRRFQAINGGLARNSPIMAARAAMLGTGNWMHQSGLQFFSTSTNRSTDAKYELKNIKVQTPAPASPTASFTFPYWLRWVLGSVLPLMLTFGDSNWDKIERIEGKAEEVVEEVEKVAKVVEKVAHVAEAVSEEVAEKLPVDNNLKKAALFVEQLSKQTAHDAQLTEDFIHKVEELKDDLDVLEAFVEPVVHKKVKKESESN